MDYKNIEKRLQAAGTILQGDTLSKSTFSALRTLLDGINPRIDRTLKAAEKVLTHIDRFQKGDVIHLTVESLPEQTEEQKKRKKALLLFLNLWKDLKSEVARVKKEIDHHNSGKHSAHGIANIIAGAKGPLGIITIVAAGIVALQVTQREIVIKNAGCDPIQPAVSFPVRVPGFAIPDATIPSGGQATAKLPPLKLTVDATSANTINLSGMGLRYSFHLEQPGIRLTFDGTLLNGSSTVVDIGTKQQHELVVQCR